MANNFKVKGYTLTDTADTTIITATGSSNFIVGSVIVCNITAVAITVDALLYDSDQADSFYIMKDEPLTAGQSREVLVRPFSLETGDQLKVRCNIADSLDVVISYLDRNRD